MKQTFFFEIVPSKTLTSKCEKSASGYETTNERVSLMFCANAIGTHKVPIVPIGKLQKPQCFKNTNIPLMYKIRGWYGLTQKCLAIGITVLLNLN